MIIVLQFGQDQSALPDSALLWCLSSNKKVIRNIVKTILIYVQMGVTQWVDCQVHGGVLQAGGHGAGAGAGLLPSLWPSDNCSSSVTDRLVNYRCFWNNFFSLGFIDFIVSPIFDVCGDMISLVLDQKEDQATKPWEKILTDNKDIWQIKVEAKKVTSLIKNFLTRLSQEKLVLRYQMWSMTWNLPG